MFFKKEGLFITFEGPNGVGKSSVLSGVALQLRRLGYEVFETKEPTFSSLGQFVLNTEKKYRGKTLACLIAADRYFHLESEVLPELSKGKIVLSDRYIESSLVLQRFDNIEIGFIWSINQLINIPDLSVILRAKSDILELRLANRDKYSRFEKEISRDEEIKYYMDALEFLSKRDFNILLLENDKSPLEQTVNEVIQKILILKENKY